MANLLNYEFSKLGGLSQHLLSPMQNFAHVKKNFPFHNKHEFLHGLINLNLFNFSRTAPLPDWAFTDSAAVLTRHSLNYFMHTIGRENFPGNEFTQCNFPVKNSKADF